MTTETFAHIRRTAGGRGPRLVSILLRADAIWRQRQRLRHLDGAALCDIGVTRAEAAAESRRPVWDAPGHWRK